MNILYISDGFTPHDRRFIEAIRSQGHRVWYADGRRGSARLPMDLQVSLWDGDVTDSDSLSRDVARLRIDAIQIGPLSGLDPSPIERVGCAVVATSWAFDVLLDSQISERGENVCRFLRRADALIVDCQAVVDRVLDLVPEFEAPIVRFPWGVSLSRFQNLPTDRSLELRDRFGWCEKSVYISTRTWDSVYGTQALLDAFGIVLKQRPESRLLMVGDGPLWAQLQRQIDVSGLRPFVQTPGSLPESELPEWFCAADVYVSAAICDGTSISLLEAMACEKPVVAHNQFGNLEWIENGENGWLCDCSRPDELAGTMLWAANERASWSTLGKRNRARVFEAADWDRHQLLVTQAFAVAVEKTSSSDADTDGVPLIESTDGVGE